MDRKAGVWAQTQGRWEMGDGSVGTPSGTSFQTFTFKSSQEGRSVLEESLHPEEEENKQMGELETPKGSSERSVKFVAENVKW